MKKKKLEEAFFQKNSLSLSLKCIRIMKLTIMLVFFGLIQVNAALYSQNTKINLSIKNVTLQQALSAIEKQSDYRFFYQNEQLNISEKVDIVASDANINEVLSQLLSNKDISYKVYDNKLVVLAASGVLQQNKVSGIITDGSTNETLIGVNVVIEGTTIGVTSDADGKFSIQIPDASSVLVFSFIGYNSERVAVGSQSTIDVKLIPDITKLDEIVVVGYGTQKKVNLTGAVSAVKIDEKITSRALTNLSSGLSGLVPGLAIAQNSGMAGNNGASMIIRGLGTVNNANPLVVVDGMPDVDINRLNMNDIESVTILKDATSSAVYGSRAANGVILITTKSGKGQGKTKINFSANYGIEKPTKAYDFMADYPRALTLHQRSASVNTLAPNLFFKNGTIDQWMALGMIEPLKYPNTDWWKVIMRDGQVQNYNLSASGGNEKSNFFISLGTMDEKGLQINNDYTRYNARFNYDYKVNSKMNIGAKFDGNWSKMTYSLEDGFIDDDPTNTAGFDLQYAISGITPFDPVTGYYGGVMAYNEDPQAYNPYTVYVNNLNYRNRQEVNPSVYWDWTPIKGLTARVDYAMNYYNQFTWNAPIPNRSYNFQTGAFGSRVYVGDNAGISNVTNTGYKTMFNSRLNYETTIASKHHLSAMVVYSEEFWYTRAQSSARTERIYPTLHEVDGALTNPGQVTAGGTSTKEGLKSYIGRLNYSAFDKYLFEANFRYDGSSKFLSKNQFGFFPSAAIGWRFTEEGFMKGLTEKWLNNGKLRLSYGALGNNSGVSYYEQRETLDPSHYIIDSNISKGLVYSKMVNESLSWESTKVMNIGLDLGFLNNRFTAEIDYYDRLTSGMNRPSDQSILISGSYNAPRQNIGDLRNRGVEGNFIWRDKKSDFSYQIGLNASYNSTSLEKWNEFLGRGWQFLNMPYRFLYTWEDAGIAQTWQDIYNATPQGASPGDILRKDLNGDGRIDDNDKKAYPNIQRERPTTNFALNGNIAWKGFDLSIILQGAIGRKDYWLNNYNNMNLGNQRYASTWNHWNNPWSWDNRGGSWPRLLGNANREETTFWLDDMSYLRVKNLQIGYSLPSRLLQRIRVESFRIFASAENLATFTKYRGLDPEKQGDKSDAYPINKSFSFGVNIGI